jgi:hypothetical protein
VWAREQSVEIAVLPEADAAAAFIALLPDLAARLDGRYRAWVRERMFMSGANAALRDSLEHTMAFTLTLPSIYRHAPVADSIVAFHDQTNVGGELYRTIVVAWRNDTRPLDGAGDVLDWRDAVAARVWSDAQVAERAGIMVTDLPVYGNGSLEVRGAWRTRDGMPQGGPLIDRIVVCPQQDRTYFLEAWLYGPGRRKYEYMLQFETILDSFGCGARSA